MYILLQTTSEVTTFNADLNTLIIYFTLSMADEQLFNNLMPVKYTDSY
jgi:hypothetical protein